MDHEDDLQHTEIIFHKIETPGSHQLKNWATVLSISRSSIDNSYREYEKDFKGYYLTTRLALCLRGNFTSQ